MFGIFLSAINTALGFVFRTVIVKFMMFVALLAVASGFMALIIPLTPVNQIETWFSTMRQFPLGLLYILDFLKFSEGIGLLLPAYAVRFLIRRIPFFG